jgi:hypothetical protein
MADPLCCKFNVYTIVSVLHIKSYLLDNLLAKMKWKKFVCSKKFKFLGNDNPYVRHNQI